MFMQEFLEASLTSDNRGNVNDAVAHGIASVFCPLAYLNRGYASRMMKELEEKLHTWQTDRFSCVGSTLYSDIGKEYYSKLGWLANNTNTQAELQPKLVPWPSFVTPVSESDLEDLSKRDESLIRSQMAMPTD